MKPSHMTKIKLVPDAITKEMDAREFVDFASKKAYLIRKSWFVPPTLGSGRWDCLLSNLKMSDPTDQTPQTRSRYLSVSRQKSPQVAMMSPNDSTIVYIGFP